MSATLTREVVSEAISFGRDVLPKFTAFELAAVLDAPLPIVLKCIQANKSAFQFDADKNITGLSTNKAIQFGSQEVWDWFVKNRAGGDREKALVVQTQQSLAATSQNPIRWNNGWTYSCCCFIDPSHEGQHARTTVASRYGAAIASRLTNLGRIDGGGVSVDKFIFGVILTAEEINSRRFDDGRPLYLTEWAYREMASTFDWVVVNPQPQPSGLVPVAVAAAAAGVPVQEFAKDPGTASVPAPVVEATAPVTPPAVAGSPAETDGKKIHRRTQAELMAARKSMVDELVSLGGNRSDFESLIMGLPKFNEAEKQYEGIKAKLMQAEKQPEAKVEDVPGQSYLPGTSPAEKAAAPATPPPVGPLVVENTEMKAPPTAQSASAVLDGLLASAAPKTVAEMKSEIKAAATPAPQAAGLPAIPPSIVIPSTVQTPPPVEPAAPAPTSMPPSSTALGLLDSLLNSTGQKG